MIRGQTAPIPKRAEIVPKVSVNVDMSIHNCFDIELVDSKTGEVRQKAQAYNVICNGFWQALANKQSRIQAIGFGSGEGTPNVSDEALFQYLGHKSPNSKSIIYEWDIPKKSVHLTCSIQLSETEYAGSDITEVGLISSDKKLLFTHAMLQDMNGNSLVLHKTDTDILNIYATVYLDFSKCLEPDSPIRLNKGKATDSTGSMPSLFYAFLGAALNLNLRQVPFPTYTKFAEGDIQSNDGIPSVTLTIDSNTKQAKFVYPRWAADKFNNRGTRDIHINNRYPSYSWYSNIVELFVRGDSPKGYNGTDIVKETIGTGDGETTKFRTKFSYISNATVYVNNQPQEVTVTENSDFELPQWWGLAEGSTIEIPIYQSDMGVVALDSNNKWRTYLATSSGNYEGSFLQGCYCNIEAYQDFEFLDVEFSWNSSKITPPDSINDFDSTIYGDLLLSMDGVNWFSLRHDTTDWNWTVTHKDYYYWFYKAQLPEEWHHPKYIKRTYISTRNGVVSGEIYFTVQSTYPDTSYNIEFSTPPAVGDVITADYHTATIAKDENHVFDLTLTVDLAEKTDL